MKLPDFIQVKSIERKDGLSGPRIANALWFGIHGITFNLSQTEWTEKSLLRIEERNTVNEEGCG